MTIRSGVPKPICLVAFSGALFSSSCLDKGASTEGAYTQASPASTEDTDAQAGSVSTQDAHAQVLPASTQDGDAQIGGEQLPCRPWQPSDAAWSSLSTSRPALLGELSVSASGTYLYSVGTWWEAGDRIRGIVRSADLGETWCVITTPASIAQVAVSHASEPLLYAMTEPRYGEPVRLLKTTDGGVTWSDRGSMPVNPVSPLGEQRLATGSLDPDTVWSGELLSVDSGETWTEVLPPALNPSTSEVEIPGVSVMGGYPSTVTVDPQSGRKLLVGGFVITLFDAGGEPKYDYLWFTSDDAGKTWHQIEAPREGAGVQVVVDAAANLYAQVPGDSLLFRSSDWGGAWESLTLPADGLSISTFGASQGNQLFTWDLLNYSGIWTSNDAGISWEVLPMPTDPRIVSAFAPEDGEVIVGGTSSGLTVTTNGGETWQQRPIVPLPGILVPSLDDAGELFSFDRAQSRGSVERLSSNDGGLTWTAADVSPAQLQAYAEVVGDLTVAQKSLNHAFGYATESGVWAPSIVGQATGGPATNLFVLLITPELPLGEPNPPPVECLLLRTDDGGTSFQATVSLPMELCRAGGKLAVSPTNEQHLVVPCQLEEFVLAMCSSWDGGLTWTLNALGVESMTNDDVVSTTAFLSDDVVLAATGTSSEVRRSTDGGTTWTQVLDHGGSRFTQSSAVPQTVFLTSEYVNRSLVFRSDDAGANWTLFSPGGPIVNPDLDYAVDRPRVFSIVDRPGGGFLASTDEGLVQFN